MRRLKQLTKQNSKNDVTSEIKKNDYSSNSSFDLEDESLSKDGGENASSDFHVPETVKKEEDIAQLNPGGLTITPETPFIVLSQVRNYWSTIARFHG